MGSLFSMLSSYDKIVVSLIIIAITFVISLLSAFLVSFKLRGSKGFFITSAIMPIIVAAVISMVSIFLDDATSGAVRIATIAVALGLIRFRSMNAKAEELLILFSGVATGLIAGLGYVVFALLFSLIVSALYILLSSLNVFNGKRFVNDKLLKITIPESLEYEEAFNDTFLTYLKNSELVEIKTIAMGSMFKLSYRIAFKNNNEQKNFIDELRTKNANLEISIHPYVGENNSL